MSVLKEAAEAYRNHKVEAHRAYDLFQSYCDYPVPRVPGMDTVIRLAYRIACGRTVEEAAAREYVYRVNLSLISPTCFGAPVLLGA